MNVFYHPSPSQQLTKPFPLSSMDLVSADQFTFDELTAAYNQTRVDYLVPMPMNVARLKEYARVYDVSLSNSCVAMKGKAMLGLGMLGIRHTRSWITRLGVLPEGRRQGTATAIMETLIASARRCHLESVWLEVIEGNDPAHQLFTNFGFVETRELIVARRPPQPQQNPHVEEQVAEVKALGHKEAVELLSKRRQQPNWLNQAETMQNARNLSALYVKLKDGSEGWVSYHASILQLTRIIVEVVKGDPTEVTAVILSVLHDRYQRQDAKTENLPDDKQWPGFLQAGYFDSFRRIEMVKRL
ncbi:MAG: GNAT family N-acetyltransferase [Chloroflexota bacterium]